MNAALKRFTLGFVSVLAITIIPVITWIVLGGEFTDALRAWVALSVGFSLLAGTMIAALP